MDTLSLIDPVNSLFIPLTPREPIMIMSTFLVELRAEPFNDEFIEWQCRGAIAALGDLYPEVRLKALRSLSKFGFPKIKSVCADEECINTVGDFLSKEKTER